MRVRAARQLDGTKQWQHHELAWRELRKPHSSKHRYERSTTLKDVLGKRLNHEVSDRATLRHNAILRCLPVRAAQRREACIVLVIPAAVREGAHAL